MIVETIKRESFSVIGKEGSTDMGEGFVKKLWDEANEHFEEVISLAKTDEKGDFVACCGLMSSFDMSFMPWEDDFKKGMYLAGIECKDDAEAPEGWKKWTVPAFEFIKIDMNECTFKAGLEYLKDNEYELVGAVQEYTDMINGKTYFLYPVKRL